MKSLGEEGSNSSSGKSAFLALVNPYTLELNIGLTAAGGMEGGSYSFKVDGIEIASVGGQPFQFSEVSLLGTCKPVDP